MAQPPSPPLAPLAAAGACALAGSLDAGWAGAALAALSGWVVGAGLSLLGRVGPGRDVAGWLGRAPGALAAAWRGDAARAAGGVAGVWVTLAGATVAALILPLPNVHSGVGRLLLAGGVVAALALPAAASWVRLAALLARLPGRLVAVAGVALPVAACLAGAWALRGFLAALPGGVVHTAGVPPAGLLLWFVLRHVPLPRPAGPLAAGVVALAAAAGAVAVHRHPGTAARVLGDSPLAGTAVLALRELRDNDGDGHSSWLGGGDCDDDDLGVHPGAQDRPGDGLDSDCSGADALAGRLALDAPRFSPTPWPADAPPRPDSAVILSIDALRADRLPPGEPSGPMPRLARFAAGGLRAERAYAPSSATQESLPALLAEGDLARTLKAAGRRTGAWVNPWTQAHLPRLGQGFSVYAPHVEQPTEAQRRAMAPHTTARGLELLDAAGDAPFLLWLHYIDPHHPYSPPGGAAGDDLARYDAELTWLDGQLAPLLDRLATPPLADRTAVVVTADHGEEFGEHGGRFHARELYEESVRVPLVLRGPGVPAGVLRGTAWLHDVSPTLLDWLGVAPPARCQPEGRSLLPAAFAGDPLPRRPLPLRVSARGLGLRRALVWWPFKLLERHREGERVLFHLVDDPRETTDASARHPDVADSLRATLAASR